MYDRRKPLKSELVTDTLRERIQGGFFPDGRLPRKSELVDFFSVSQKTIESALRTLTSEGLIHGVRGTGLFVNQTPSDAPINLTHRLVMTVMHPIGDYYGIFYDTLRETLLQHSLLPLNFSQDDTFLRLTNLSGILSAPIRGVIYHGGAYWRNPFLESWKNMRSVLLDWFDGIGTPPGSAVLVDYAAGGYTLARHCLEQGRTKIGWLHTPLPSDFPSDNSLWQNHMYKQMENGIQKAIKEFHADALKIFSVNLDNGCRELTDILTLPLDAILCSSDHIAHWCKIAARALGKTTPEDFFLAGCYNTPWSTETDIPFTSLKIDVKTICQSALDLLDKGGQREIISSTPVPIWRSTTGSRPDFTL